jgi:hypothetical protein
MPKADPRFLEGLRLFNHGEYFECHEVIEDLWLETPTDDPHRDLYKGVIQAAAAIYQEQRGIESGALGLHKTAVQYLAKYTPEALGLKVTPLIDGLNDYFKHRDKKHIPVLEFKL